MSRQVLSCAALLGALPVLLIVSLITFGMMQLIPGDPGVGHRRA